MVAVSFELVCKCKPRTINTQFKCYIFDQNCMSLLDRSQWASHAPCFRLLAKKVWRCVQGNGYAILEHGRVMMSHPHCCSNVPSELFCRTQRGVRTLLQLRARFVSIVLRPSCYCWGWTFSYIKKYHCTLFGNIKICACTHIVSYSRSFCRNIS